MIKLTLQMRYFLGEAMDRVRHDCKIKMVEICHGPVSHSGLVTVLVALPGL